MARWSPACSPPGDTPHLLTEGTPTSSWGSTRRFWIWAAGQGLRWDMSSGDSGDRWGSRLEIHLTDPRQEPDMSKWQTQLAFRLAD